MKLPFLSQSDNKKECYLGIFLQEKKTTGYVYELSGNNIHILEQYSAEFSDGLKKLVEDIDDILFRLETDTNKKLKKTIFFVTSQYVDDSTKQIKKEYKGIIKSVVKELELEALGFIECYEAVSTLLSKKSGTQLNAILVELDKTITSITVFKNDKLAYNSSFMRSDSLSHDLTKIFNTVQSSTMLPSRIVLYPYYESRKELVHLINHKWDTDLFVQIPKIESLSEEDLSVGLSEIFASQILSDDTPISSTEEGDVEINQEDEKTQEKEELPKEEIIAQSVPVKNSSKKGNVMGFTVANDIVNNEIEENNLDQTAETEREVADEKNNEKTATPQRKSLDILSIMKTKLFLILVVILIVIGALLVGTEYLLHTVTVTISLPTKSIEKKLKLDASDLRIKTGSISADIAESQATTGKKDVGEKAKGEVTIHNFDDKDRVLTKGTLIQADGKKFTLDQEIKVASASVSSIGGNYVKQPGKTKASVTADAIGSNSNLDKGKQFSVSDFSSSLIFAVNEAAFSGGTQRQAQTVAKKDLEDLKSKALDEGKKKGLDQMRKEVSADQQIIESLTEQTLDDIKYSKEVGDEAKEVSVKAKVTTSYSTYSDNELKQAVQKSFQSEVASGFKLTEDKITANIKNASKDKEDTKLTVDAKGISVKEVSKDLIQSKLAGKSKDEVDSFMKSDLKAVDYSIDNRLEFFPFSNWIPFFKKNIKIEIKSS